MFLVGLLGSRLVGAVMAGYEGHRGWINYLAVAPDCRKRGVRSAPDGGSRGPPESTGMPEDQPSGQKFERRCDPILQENRLFDRRRGQHGQTPRGGLRKHSGLRRREQGLDCLTPRRSVRAGAGRGRPAPAPSSPQRWGPPAAGRTGRGVPYPPARSRSRPRPPSPGAS